MPSEFPDKVKLEKVTTSLEARDSCPLKELMDNLDYLEQRQQALKLIQGINQQHRDKPEGAKLPEIAFQTFVPEVIIGRNFELTTSARLNPKGLSHEIPYIEILNLKTMERTSNCHPTKSQQQWLSDH